jgi:hypothetical protein
VLALQSSAAFATASYTGGYAFGLAGYAAGSGSSALVRRGLIGEVQLNGTGVATSSELLFSTATSTTPTTPTVAVAVSAAGRGTLSFTLPGGAGTVGFTIYAVSASRFFLLSSGAAGTVDLLAGEAQQQTIANGNFAGSSLNGAAVLRAERLALQSNGSTLPDVQIGLFNFTSNSKATLSIDENLNGAPSTIAFGGGYTVSATGRATFTLGSGLGGCINCVSAQTFAYLTGANQGFYMDLSPSVNTGYFEPQTATSPSVASLNGTYALGSLDPEARAVGQTDGVLTSAGSGSATETLDQVTYPTLTPDNAVSATTTVSATGRVVLSVSSGTAVGYVISANKILLLDTTSGLPVVEEVQHQ